MLALIGCYFLITGGVIPAQATKAAMWMGICWLDCVHLFGRDTPS